MKTIALCAIRLYQRFISPYKGYCCAYRAYTGHASCSALGYRAIRRHGIWRGTGILRQRLARCGAAYRHHAPPRAAVRGQGGFCDLPCDADCACAACDVLSSCDLPCDLPCDCADWLSSRRKRKEGVYLPHNNHNRRSRFRR